MMNRDIYKREERLKYWISRAKADPYNSKEILKFVQYFYKVVYGDNEYYPEQVAWITNRVSKDKRMEK